jgi:hypothetical protein
MALRWSGADYVQVRTSGTLLQRPMEDSEIAELIQLCLTTPFDRALIRCVDDGRPPRLCLDEFENRRAVTPARSKTRRP